MRHNGGGEAYIRDFVTKRFLDSPLMTPGSYRYGVFQEGILLEPSAPFFFKNDVVVLTNGVSFSATELFARDMQTIDRVTIVGDTTGGGGASVQSYPLPHGAEIKLTYRNYLRYDLKPLEWNGAEPDVVIPQNAFDIENGVDKQLEYAIELLKN